MDTTSSNKRHFGLQSESIAKTYLEKQGLKIIKRNHFQRSGEIDIIATENKEIVFVEVKSLNSESFLEITDTISYSKHRRLIKLAKIWLCKHNQIDSKFRIDFFGIVYNNHKVIKIVHIKNAIY